MRGDRDAVRALLQQGADVNAAQGDGMTALHWAAERGDAEMTAMLRLRRRERRRGDPHRPVHAAAPRQPGRAARGREGAARAPARAWTRDTSTTGVTAAAPRGRRRQRRRSSTALLDRGADVNAQRERVGPDAADLRGRAQPRRGDQGCCSRAAPTRTSPPRPSTSQKQHAARPGRERNGWRKVLEASAGKNGKPTPSQVQAAVQASRELYASGKLPDARERRTPAAEGGQGSGQNFNSRRRPGRSPPRAA